MSQPTQQQHQQQTYQPASQQPITTTSPASRGGGGTRLVLGLVAGVGALIMMLIFSAFILGIMAFAFFYVIVPGLAVIGLYQVAKWWKRRR